MNAAEPATALEIEGSFVHAPGGKFVSLLDPDPDCIQLSKTCRNIGTWPVLVGDKEKHEHDTMLSSPIILYDYPEIAPESAGDLFDSTEIDELLTLRVQALTDTEKIEMQRVDEQARKILERAENLRPEDFLKMHGTLRDVRKTNEEFFNPGQRRETAVVDGVTLRTGDRVRIRPKRRADVMFLGAQIVVINKIDLADAMGVSVEALTNDVHTLKPDINVIPTSCRTGEGIDHVAETLLSL